MLALCCPVSELKRIKGDMVDKYLPKED
ncbi:MAG: hypothetical protein ACLRWQ_10330 [Flavonifractor plautii]